MPSARRRSGPEVAPCRKQRRNLRPVLKLAATGLVVALLASPANAETICAREVVRTFNEVRIYSREFTAACRLGAECSITTHQRDDSATLGFSHSVSFVRADPDAAWRLVLVDETDALDVAQPVTLDIDDNASITAPAGSMTGDLQARRYELVEPDSAAVLEQAKPGNVMKISYRTPTGADRSATVSLIGLGDALTWTSCAQGELKSGKADAAMPGAGQPEFSGPEPGVPIDPDGRETGEVDE